MITFGEWHIYLRLCFVLEDTKYQSVRRRSGMTSEDSQDGWASKVLRREGKVSPKSFFRLLKVNMSTEFPAKAVDSVSSCRF